MASQLPESNGDIVALNIVHHAIVDDINTPGDALAQLFERMAVISRDIGGEFRASDTDWAQMLEEWNNTLRPEVIQSTIDRQALSVGDVWAKNWMLALMAKHLYHLLEKDCIDHPFAGAIEKITYGEDGSLESWSRRNS